MQVNKVHKIIVLVAFTLTLSTPTALALFDDVFQEHPNFDAINYVHDEGIVEGYPDFNYKPDKTINRAEFTKIIVESQFLDNVINSCTGNEFPDVPQDEWFTKYVCTAKSSNIVGGYPDGTFKPASTINFVEAAKVIVSSFDYPATEEEIWYEGYVKALEEVNAIPTTIKSFDQEISRGEMAEIIFRLKNNVLNKASTTYEILSAEAGTGPAPDYSSYMQWAIPTPQLNYLLQEGSDCAWIDAGWTGGGDLLSSLIADQDAQALANLDIYTPEYLSLMEKAIVAQTNEKWNKDFYAFYVCNMGILDVVSGYLYPKGESAFDQENPESATGDLDYNDTAIAIVNGDKIQVYNYIRVIGGTATGAEPPVCTGELIMYGVLWECFLGLHLDENDGVDGSFMEYTTIMLDGEVSTREEVIYDEF